uniref:CCHC-type domain-containing protein n=1 Tax=Aegilops tauschii subsp. strangulata TaxID=200361 RepID=A0A453SUP7_AEGTS
MKKGKNAGKNKQAYTKLEEIAATEYADVICYSCGEPGHHKINCPSPPVCFICKVVTHKVEDCPVRRKPRNPAKFVGSGAPGLGYHQIDVPDVNDQHIGARRNVGLVYVESGQVDKQELGHNFSLIYKTNWPWQIRKLDEWTFLVKFPPHIPVESVARYPLFGLPEMDGVTVNVEVWKGTLEHYSELQKVWLKLEGIAPAWAEWSVLEQFASVFGTLIDVDWLGNFKSFFETVRIKIRCKDHTKIPPDRLFGIGDHLFKVKITVEPPVEEADMEEPAYEDIEDSSNEAGQDKEKRDAGRSTKEKDSSRTGSTHSLQGSKSASGNSNQNTKQKVISYLQQLQEPITMGQSYSLLQEMELMDDEDDLEKNISLEDSITKEVEMNFSPQLDTILGRKDQNNPKPHNKWGPVQAQRKSSRVNIGDRSMMEIAMNNKKVQNLEMGKKNNKGTIVRNSFAYFSDPKFIAVANRVGIEIDSSQVDVNSDKLDSVFQMSEGQKKENTKQNSDRILADDVE